jgi:uncharacterized protein YgfB (UPF0149 family)
MKKISAMLRFERIRLEKRFPGRKLAITCHVSITGDAEFAVYAYEGDAVNEWVQHVAYGATIEACEKQLAEKFNPDARRQRDLAEIARLQREADRIAEQIKKLQ